MIEFVAHLRNHDDFVEGPLTIAFPAGSAVEALEIVRQCCAGEFRWNSKKQGEAHTLRQALATAGAMFGDAEEARMAARGPFATRAQVDTQLAVIQENRLTQKKGF